MLKWLTRLFDNSNSEYERGFQYVLYRYFKQRDPIEYLEDVLEGYRDSPMVPFDNGMRDAIDLLEMLEAAHIKKNHSNCGNDYRHLMDNIPLGKIPLGVMVK